MQTLGMILYAEACTLFAARGQWFAPWDKLTEKDKEFYETLAEAFAKKLQ